MSIQTKTTIQVMACFLLLTGVSYACNLTPIADIDTDPNNRCLGETIVFDGSGSYDPDGGSIVAYRWVFPEGAYDISGSHTSAPSCKFTSAGDHEISLKVLDDDGDWSVEYDTCTVKVIEVESLLPDLGAEIDDGEPNSRTFVVCTAGSGDVTVTATPYPSVTEANLPVCWSMSGGTGSGQLSRTVSLTSTGSTQISVSTCGTSGAITIIDVSADNDSDSMPDDWETHFGLNPSDPDDADLENDDDGLSNLEEYQAGTDPNNNDTDDDGIDDDWEVDYQFDPLNATDADLDLDQDGYTNLGEYLHSSDPNDSDSYPTSNITIYIPGDVSVIQSAIYAAIEGDVIELAQGTYYEAINFAGKNITIQGSDPDDWDVVEATIIDASDLGPAVTFSGTEDPNCYLTGITVTGGLAGQRDGLVAYWNLDETSGTTAYDGSGNSHDGTLTNGPVWDSNGYIDGALYFDGTNDYVEISGYKGVCGDQSRSVCAWIKTQGGEIGDIVSWGMNTTGHKWRFTIGWSLNPNSIQLHSGAGYITSTTDVCDDMWHHVAVVFENDGTPNVEDVRLFVDGKEEVITNVQADAIDTSNDVDVEIGNYSTGSASYFNGFIDDVRIYDRGLNANEVAELADKGMVAHWRLDETSGSTAYDSFDSKDGTLTDFSGTDSEWQRGVHAGALDFDGTDDYVQITGYKGITGSQALTCAAWIKAKPGTAVPGEILFWGASTDIWRFYVKGQLQLDGKLVASASGGYVVGTTDVCDGYWHHVAAVLADDGSPNTDEIKLYVDGREELISLSSAAAVNTSIGSDVQIGGVTGSYFDGLIDDVRIYQIALTETEIGDIYVNGGGVMGNGATANISKCVIRDNFSANDGGGISYLDGTISRCIIRDNIAEYVGGGLANCDGTIINSVITDNAALYGGGLTDCDGQIADCVIAHNEADYGGGLDNCDAQIVNCTIVKNEASTSNEGGGLRDCDTTNNASAEITNCIIYANLAGGTKNQLSNCLAPTYSCIQDGSTANGNIVDNPYFQDPNLADISAQTNISNLKGPDGLFGTSDDGYCLTAYSLCVDSAYNDSLDFDDDGNDDILLDFRGNTRKVDIPEAVDFGSGTSPIVDMGVCEVQLSDLSFPYTATSFESSEGFELTYSIGDYDNWTVDAGTATIKQADFYEDESTSVPYQYVDISTSSTVTHEASLSDQTSHYIGISCIPSVGTIIKIMDANDIVAAVKFHDTVDKIQVYDSDSLSYIDPSPAVSYQTVASECRAFLEDPTEYCEDPNSAYSYENTWIRLEIRIDWSGHTYDVFWRHKDNTPGALIEDNIPLNTTFDKFTKIVFENPSATEKLEVNRLTFSEELTGGGQMGQDEGIWIVLPEADIENPLQGHCVIAGTIWYDGMSQYKIKCCPTDANTLDPKSWLMVAGDAAPKKNMILGFWDTWGFRNGDYYLKIELYDELGYLLDTFDDVITKEISYKNSSDETITKDVNVAFSIIGRGKGKTYHYEERPDITVNWPGSFAFEFKRIYDDNLRNSLYPLFFGWTHNHNIRISEDTTRDWVTKTVETEEVPDGDGNQLGIGRVWFQQALGSRMFLYDSSDSNKVTYKPVDGEKDYVIRTSTVDANDFDLDYVHYATDGMKMTFDGIALTPGYTPATGQGAVDWTVQKGIEKQEDRFGSALDYKWNNEMSGRESHGEYYIMEISNNRTPTKIVFEDNLVISSDPNGPQLYSKLKLSDGDSPIDIMTFEIEGAGTDLEYIYTKTDDNYWEDPSYEYLEDQSRWFYFIGNGEVILESVHLPYVRAFFALPGHAGYVDIIRLDRYSDDSLKEVEVECVNHFIYGLPGLDFITTYSYQYDSGNLTISTDYSVSSSSNNVLLRNEQLTTTPEGAVIEQKNTTYDTTYSQQPFNPYNYKDVKIIGSEDFYDYLYKYCWHAGGGGATETQYFYTDEGYPFKPTMIVEYYDNDSNSLTNESTRTKTMQYDSRGNLIEQRSYVDSANYVLAQYDYHDTYNFPVRKTTWQGYCYDDGLGDPVTSGAKVEQRWLYGDPNGTPLDGDDSTPGKKGDFLVEEKTLIDETADEWAVTDYEYYPIDDSDGLFEDGQIKIKDVTVNSENSNLTFYEYDPNGFPSKEWHGATVVSGEPQGDPQKRYRYDGLGRKILDADYLGKVQMYLYTNQCLVEVRKYFDSDAMTVDDPNFVVSRYDDDLSDPDGDDYRSRTQYMDFNFYDRPQRQELATGGISEQGYFHDGEKVVYREYSAGWFFFIGYADDGRTLAIRKTGGIGGDVYAYLVYDSMNRLLHQYDYNYTFQATGHPNPFIKHSEYGYYGTGKKKFEVVYKVVRTGTASNPVFTSETEKHTEFYYDAQDRLVMQVEDPDGDAITTEYGYDAAGNRIYVVNPKGKVIFTDYDNANRKVAEYFAETLVSDPDPNFVATYDNAVVRKEVEYYRNGKVKTATSYDYDGSTILSCSEYTYDARGRVDQVKQHIDDTPTYATTTYDYYDEKVSSGVSGDPNYYHICITDAEGKETWIELTPDAKPAKVLYPSGDYEKIEYYGHGLPKKKYVWDADGDEHTILYEYDEFGKLEKVTYPDDPDTQENESGTLEYEYTVRTLGKYGKVKTITDNRCDADRPGDPNSVYTFDYYNWSGNLLSYTDYEGFTTTYDYNTAWKRKTQIEVANPSDEVVYLVDYSYNLAGRLETVTDSNSLDPQYVAGFDYDDNGNRTELDYYLDGTLEGNTYGMDYTHNADNFLTGISTDSTTSGAPVFIFDADDSGDIDGLGRLTNSDETLYPDTSSTSHTFDYTYDMMSQLTSGKATDIDGLDWIREDFVYNKDGNVTDCNVVGSDSSLAETDYSYTNSGDSDIMASATGDGAFTLSNDLNGNTTKLPTSSANDTIEYNWDNKLRSASKGSDSITVKYDPMGNRVYKSSYDGSGTTVQKFVVDIAGKLPTIIGEYTDPNSFTNSYIYADAQILVQYAHSGDPNVADDKYYYVHDRLGSVRMVVDCNTVAETVTARNTYTYSPFGNPYTGELSETVYNPFQFTGQWLDVEIDQYYLRARMYDPTMMRFTTRDPVRGKYKEPLTLHKYLYTANDSINRIDPTGRILAILEPIMAGHSVHAFAVTVTAVGMAEGNWNIISFGIALDRTILPVMAIVMGTTYRPQNDKNFWSIIGDYNSGANSNLRGGGWNKLPKWGGIAAALAVLLYHNQAVVDGLVQFSEFIDDLLFGDEQPEIGPGP